ncbi:MAG: hypothetical protein CL878_09595, partial [Dehalococcoidia bacterium]|nr:hypothetical protein [Dehalococcoidia bacterium]
MSLAAIATGDDTTCGITTSGRAYCWGEDNDGEVGNGNPDTAAVGTPGAVAGGLTIRTGAPSVEPASVSAGATGNVFVDLRHTNTHPSDGRIAITFPSGFNVGGVNGQTATSLSGIDGTLARAGGNPVAGGTAVSFVLPSIRNPQVSGSTGTFAIQTQNSAGAAIDQDTAIAPATLFPGSLSSISVTLASLVVGAAGNATVGFTTGNPLPSDGKIAVTFPAGFSLSGTNTVTPGINIDGTFNISVSGQTVTLTRGGGRQVAANTAITVTMGSITNPNTAGSTGTFAIQTQHSSGVAIDQDASVAGVAIEATNVAVIDKATNDPPVLVTNLGLTLARGASASIGRGELEATDRDHPSPQLRYTVTDGPAHGTLSSKQFGQNNVNDRGVVYTHDGSASTSDSFSFTVTDSAGASISGTFAITIIVPTPTPTPLPSPRPTQPASRVAFAPVPVGADAARTIDVVRQSDGGRVVLQSTTGRHVTLTFYAPNSDLIVQLAERGLPPIRMSARPESPVITSEVLQGFTVEARQARTGAMVTRHDRPVDIEVQVDPQVIAAVGSRPDLVRLGRMDEATGRIVVLPTTVDGSSVRARTRQTSTFVLLAMIPPTAGADWPLTNGHQFTQAAGADFAVRAGYPVEDVSGGPPFWTAFRQQGGVATLGYPVSQVFVRGGIVVQVLQKGVLQQWASGSGPVTLLNLLDLLSRAGFDAVLDQTYHIPPPRSTVEDIGLTWAELVARHLAIFDEDVPGIAAIRARYEETAASAGQDPIQLWGLPLSVKDYGPFVTLRTQRAAFQHWKVALPELGPEYVPGFVAIVNVGDIAKAIGLWPEEPLLPLLVPAGLPI